MANQDIEVKSVDVDLLRDQRDYLLSKFEAGTDDMIDGLVNLLDTMLDTADGV